MCTAFTYESNHFYFGRTLDNDCSYGEEVVILPRNFPLSFRYMPDKNMHYSILGVAHVSEGYPLFYDAINEKGLAIAGLNFVGNAHYFSPSEGKNNVAQFEWIPWLLSQAQSVKEVREMLANTQIVNVSFRDDLPCAKLHWIIADEKECIVVESLEDGLHIYDNPLGVLTNNPTFEQHLKHWNAFSSLSPYDEEKVRTIEEQKEFSRGMSSIGLPGDYSSKSRFVRAAFVRKFSVSKPGEIDSVSQFFHLLHSVDQPRGVSRAKNDAYEMTLYANCYDTRCGVCYYTTYHNHQIHAVELWNENLDGKELYRFPMVEQEQIHYQNQK